MNDYIIRATAANDQIRAFAAVTTEMVETAREHHNTSPVATAALGRLLTAGAMMGSMMKGEKDVLTLLSATEEMASDYADRPIITMSMAGLGSISRIACEAFGSCLTFGSGAQASAPGQIGAEKLHQALQIVHDAL